MAIQMRGPVLSVDAKVAKMPRYRPAAGTTCGRLCLVGALDLADRVGLKKALTSLEILDRVLVDLSETTYIDSTVLGCLSDLHKRMVLNGRHGIITIVGASKNLQRIFEISGLSKVFEMQQGPASDLAFQQDRLYRANARI